jgi:uncharacterized protein YkwD/Zn ribbon nucleic-acid-binding protein
MFCRHSYRYTQGYFYCVKCGHRSYKQHAKRRSTGKKFIIAGVLAVIAVGAVFAIQGTTNPFSNNFATSNLQADTADNPKQTTLTNCQMKSDGTGQVDVKCEGHDELHLWREPALNPATVDGVTLIIDNGRYQMKFMAPTGVMVSYDLEEKGLHPSTQVTDDIKVKYPILDETIVQAREKVESIKETIKETIPEKPIQIPKMTLGKPEISTADLEQKIHLLINAERQKHGLASLSWDVALANIARYHSQDMAIRGYFSHDTPEGVDPTGRAASHGYRCQKTVGNLIYSGVAENLFQNNLYDRVWYTGGIPTSYEWNSMDEIAESTVNGWMASMGHRQNILTGMYDREGIGIAISSDDKVYITQNFC